MLPYNQEHLHAHYINGTTVFSFVAGSDAGIDPDTVAAFGEEWKKFDDFADQDINQIAAEYFDLFPESFLHPAMIVLDAGCGSGRWARYLAPKVRFVEAIDPSEAVFSALSNPKNPGNIRYTQASISNLPFADESFDLVICLGVLHHTPDPPRYLADLVKKLKPGASLLLYLYYALETRGFLYKSLFRLSNLLRMGISRSPGFLKRLICDIIALCIYWPLTRIPRLLKHTGLAGKSLARWPLAYYQDKSMRILRNDALDRFGTPLEKRFSREQTLAMMQQAGLQHIVFSGNKPYWHALGRKA